MRSALEALLVVLAVLMLGAYDPGNESGRALPGASAAASAVEAANVKKSRAEDEASQRAAEAAALVQKRRAADAKRLGLSSAEIVKAVEGAAFVARVTGVPLPPLERKIARLLEQPANPRGVQFNLLAADLERMAAAMDREGYGREIALFNMARTLFRHVNGRSSVAALVPTRRANGAIAIGGFDAETAEALNKAWLRLIDDGISDGARLALAALRVLGVPKSKLDETSREPRPRTK